MLEFQHYFTTSFRYLFVIHLIVTYIVAIFINMINQTSLAFKYGFATILINFLISHLLLAYIFVRHAEIDQQKPFHEWIWLSNNFWHRFIIFITFLGWLVSNFLVISDSAGVTVVLAIFGSIEIIYWFITMCAMVYSWSTQTSTTTPV